MTEREIIESIETTIDAARAEQEDIVFQLNALCAARDILKGKA
jgi:hypothetical protein